MEGTRVFGQSDDNVYAEGDIDGQYTEYGLSDNPAMLIASDGTLFTIKYGKADLAIWAINLIKQGSLFDRIEHCGNDDADIYSDIIYFKQGLRFIYACSEWEKIK